MKRIKSFLAALILVLCVSVSGSEAAVLPVEVQAAAEASAVRLSKSAVTLIKGQKMQLSVIGSKEKAVWNSNNKSVAVVSSKGIVTAKGRGTAVVTARLKARVYSCKVTVQTPYLSKQNQSINAGKTFTLKLQGTNQKVTWSSSNKSVATVSAGGKVSARKAGTCSITAKVLGRKYVCKITVKNPSGSSGTVTSSVWISATGSKYHKIPNCGRMNPNKARKMSLADARARGYGACSKCF